MTIGVYVLKSPNSWNCYVGSSIDCEKRIKAHFTALRSRKHHSAALQRALQRAFEKYGEGLEFYIVWECARESHESNPSLIREIEGDFIADFGAYNMTHDTYAPTRDARVAAKVSDALKGHKVSKITRYRISAAKVGVAYENDRLIKHRERMRTPEMRARLGKNFKNDEPWSESRKANHLAAMNRAEVRKRMAEINKGRKHPPDEIARRAASLIKLNAHQVADIRRNFDPSNKTHSYEELGTKHGVKYRTVFSVVKYQGVYAS